MDKIIKYIDCNGIILDTETGLFDEYYKLKKTNPGLSKKQYLEELDWDDWVKRAKIINDSIRTLKRHDPEKTIILTKISTLDEGIVKTDYFRNLGVKNTIGLIPYSLQKNQMAYAKGNILFDNSLKNLDYWYEAGGIPIYYSDKEHDFFPTTTSLEEVLSEEILDNPKVKKIQAKKRI